MTEDKQPKNFKFGYFPRNKYKDLVFYVKTGECSNCGLFEMPDTPENRALMEALISLPPVSTPSVPDSTRLIEMAKTEWKNREERRGIHNREDWCCGWMAGFLSVDKPDWSKEHDAAIAQAARDKILPFVEAAKNTQSELFRNCWDKNTIELVKQIGSDLRVIEESLRRSKQEQKP